MNPKKFNNIQMEKDFENGQRKGRCLTRLYFGKRKILMSAEELEKIETLYNSYVETNAVEIGFVNHLLKGC